MTSFSLGDTVSTTKGKGEVVYVEDGYIEVDINGVEMSFEYPFSGISEWVEPEPTKTSTLDNKPTPEYDAAWDYAESSDPLAVILAKGMHAKAAILVNMTGGEAGPWDELNSFQKFNYLKLASGRSLEDIVKEAQAETRSEG